MILLLFKSTSAFSLRRSIGVLQIQEEKQEWYGESKNLKLINACTEWKVLSTDARKAAGYRMLKNYHFLIIEDREELFRSEKDLSESHKQVLYSKNMFDAIKKEHDKADYVEARTLMQKNASAIR